MNIKPPFPCHWCASVLNKRFITSFRDGIWNRRQVSVGDRGLLPTRPTNHRGYALLAHTLGKMRSCATGERANTVTRTVVLKNTIIQAKSFPVVSTSHTVSPRETFPFVYTSHTVTTRKTFAQGGVTQSFEENVVCDCSSIQRGLFLETVCVA